jgi:hypothetical protein
MTCGLKRRGKGKENDRASGIWHKIRCEGRGYKDVCSKTGAGGKEVRESN